MSCHKRDKKDLFAEKNKIWRKFPFHSIFLFYFLEYVAKICETYLKSRLVGLIFIVLLLDDAEFPSSCFKGKLFFMKILFGVVGYLTYLSNLCFFVLVRNKSYNTMTKVMMVPHHGYCKHSLIRGLLN